MTSDTSPGNERRYGTLFLGLVVLVWIACVAVAITHQGTWLDETTYVIKSWWYVSGKVEPYSPSDPTAYLPLHFFSLGAWQWLFGHDLIIARMWPVTLTAINIVLVTLLLRRLGAGVWAMGFASMLLVLSEESIFYFTSATPYATAVFLQMLTFHILVRVGERPTILQAISLAVTLTLVYLLRIDLFIFIALIFGTLIYRCGWRSLPVFAAAAVVCAATWTSLALLWGREFIHYSLALPGLSHALIKLGIIPDFYPYATQFASYLNYDPPRSIIGILASALRLEIFLDWTATHHISAVVGAGLATIVAYKNPTQRRGWMAYFAAVYWSGLAYYIFAGQLQCAICVQAYANYIDYLGALAGGLAFQVCTEREAGRGRRELVRFRKIAITVALAAVALQVLRLHGSLRLPSAFREPALPPQVRLVADAVRGLVPPGDEVAVVGVDNRILLGLSTAGVRFPPVNIGLYSHYRLIQAGISPEQVRGVDSDVEAMGSFTDATARKWMERDFNWLLVQEEPQPAAVTPWNPSSPLVLGGLSRCFTKNRTIPVSGTVPALRFSLYRRTASGPTCAPVS